MCSQRGRCLHWSQMVGGGLAFTTIDYPPDYTLLKPAKHPRGVPADDDPGGNILEKDGMDAHHRIAADSHAW
jgi:hypothetical protein